MKTIATWLIMCVMMTALAFLFVEGLERQEFIDQAKHAKRMGVLDTEPPLAPTGVRPKYGESSAPRVHHYQDASQRQKGGK
jgi:hypothetical protein